MNIEFYSQKNLASMTIDELKSLRDDLIRQNKTSKHPKMIKSRVKDIASINDVISQKT